MKAFVKSLRLAVLPVFVGVAAGCGGGGKGGGEGASPVTGVWSVASNTVWDERFAGTFGYLELRADGTGTAYGARTFPAVRGCTAVLHVMLADAVVAIDAPELTESFWGEDRTRIFSVEEHADGTVSLRTAAGGQVELVPASAIPDSARCEELPSIEEQRLAFGATFSSGLVWTDAGLVYESYALGSTLIDPVTGSTSGTLSVTGTVHAAQGVDFWVLTGGDVAERRTTTDVLVDAVSMTDAWGDFVYLRGAAWDGTALFVHGSYQGESRILRILTEGEPDSVVLSSTAIDMRIRGMTLHGGTLWLIVEMMGHVLVELDPADLTMLRSIDLPPRADWHGLASDGTNLYALADRDDAFEGEIGFSDLVRLNP